MHGKAVDVDFDESDEHLAIRAVRAIGAKFGHGYFTRCTREGPFTEELAAQGCPLLFLIVAGMCGPIISDYGTVEQRERWLPGLASGRNRMAFAITEADAGSNATNIATTATTDGDTWLINGAKQFITGMDVADAVLVETRTGTGRDGRGLLTLFVVDVGAPGVTCTPIPMEVKARDRQFSVFFDQAAVPADRLVGGVPDQGLTQPFSGLN